MTVLPQAFHEFQPSGGVSASTSSPPTIVIVPVALPFALLTVISTGVRPACLSDAGDDSGLRIERETGGQVLRRKGQGLFTGRRDAGT